MIRSIAIVLLLSPLTAVPCTCVDPGKDSSDKVIEAACNVDAIFVGSATNELSAPDHLRKIQIVPSKVYKGQVPSFVIVETFSTCDHWFSVYEEYLIFGDFTDVSNQVATSICRPARYTGKLSAAKFQFEIIEEVSSDLDELCGNLESALRQRRIAAQDQSDREDAEAEMLRRVKEGIKRGRADYEEALETTRPEQNDGS